MRGDGRVMGRTPISGGVPVRAYDENGQAMLACTSNESVTFKWESGARVTVTNLCSGMTDLRLHG